MNEGGRGCIEPWALILFKCLEDDFRRSFLPPTRGSNSFYDRRQKYYTGELPCVKTGTNDDYSSDAFPEKDEQKELVFYI